MNHVFMTKNRLEAFTDGVIAIIITILVLEIHLPEQPTWQAFAHTWPILLSYLLSFLYVGIYWNNHHHLFQGVQRINAKVMWANMILLFWLSLMPLATGWMGEHRLAPVPMIVYAIVLLGCAISFIVLAKLLVKAQDNHCNILAKAMNKDYKGTASIVLYTLAVLVALAGYELVCFVLLILVALLWLVPDTRIEKAIAVVEKEL